MCVSEFFWKPWSRSFPVTDGCFTQHQTLCGDVALSDIDGVVSSRLPGLIQLGNLPVRATATKHAGQVWLCALSEIDITSRSISNQRFRKVNAQSLQSKVTDSRGQLCPPPRCDCCFKELSDSLTSLYSTAPTPLLCKLHLLPSPLSFLLFSFLSHSD